MPEYTLIDTPYALTEFAACMPRTFAFDTEFTYKSTYKPIPELLQIATNKCIGIVDLRANLPLQKLANWFQARDVVRVAFSAENDVGVLNEVFRVQLGPIEDVQLAVAFLKSGKMPSYAKVVAECFDVQLDKTMQRSRWDLRPLAAVQLDYAAMDICYLNALWLQFGSDLQNSNRFEWYSEERDRVQRRDASDPRSLSSKAKSLLQLSEQGLCFFQLLDTWRTDQAALLNIPRNWIMAKDALVKLATTPRLNDRVLGKALSERQLIHHRSTLHALYRKACTAARDSEFPPPRELRKTVISLRNRCANLAQRLDLNEELLASSKDLLFALREYLVEGRFPLWFGRWRSELIGKITIDAAKSLRRNES